MAYELENIVREWMDHLKGLNVEVKKMFGCYCLYCDGQAVGWIHNSVMSLREVGLDYLPKDIKRPTKEDKIQELVIPLDYANADWLPKAVQDTAAIRKRNAVVLIWFYVVMHTEGSFDCLLLGGLLPPIKGCFLNMIPVFIQTERQIWLLAAALEIVLFHSDLIIVQRLY